jgi:hypothetical protein
MKESHRVGFENVLRLASIGGRIGRRAGSRIASAAAIVWLWMLVEAPGIAQACSVCTAGRDEENQTAFLLSTIFMSLLPLMSLGTLVWVLWRRIRKLEAETERRSEAAMRPPAGA